MKKFLSLLSFLSLMITVKANTLDGPPTGMYSNNSGGFDAANVFLSSSGYGFLRMSFGGVGGTWEVFEKGENTFVHMHLFDIVSSNKRIKENSALFVYEQSSKSLNLAVVADSLEIAMKEYEKQSKSLKFSREKVFGFVSKEIPQHIEEVVVNFPAELERARFRVKYYAEQKAAEEARLKAEQPIYEECLKKISEDPQYVLSIQFKFYQKGDSADFLIGRIKPSPESRAVTDALKNKDIVFPEEVLMKFLERFEWDRCFYVIRPIFSRDELSEASRRKLHPRMQEFSRNTSNDIAREFYEHKNTPIDLLKEACEWKIISLRYLEERERALKNSIDDDVLMPNESK
ncbi:MAG: hypothetical protein IJ444_07605 [Kiritimatiellae bacterium]|nr:hypothetical protein [Kiritimatiellia bacterium]